MKPKPLQIKLDKELDLVEIDGMKYAGSLFRAFAEGGLPVGGCFSILKREDGAIILSTHRFTPAQARTIAFTEASMMVAGLISKGNPAAAVLRQIIARLRDLSARKI